GGKSICPFAQAVAITIKAKTNAPSFMKPSPEETIAQKSRRSRQWHRVGRGLRDFRQRADQARDVRETVRGRFCQRLRQRRVERRRDGLARDTAGQRGRRGEKPRV